VNKQQLEELQNPVNWAYMATALQKAASQLDWTRKKDITDWRYVPIYRMLIGFSLENLLKGIFIAENPEGIEVSKLNHGLKQYAEKIKGVHISSDEKALLAQLEPYVKWAGRYPMPKKPQNDFIIEHSKHLWDVELNLGQFFADRHSRHRFTINRQNYLMPLHRQCEQ